MDMSITLNPSQSAGKQSHNIPTGRATPRSFLGNTAAKMPCEEQQEE